MRDSTIAYLKAIAPLLLEGKHSNPCPIVEQRAIAILKILRDYEWHTATEISEQLGIGRHYANDILKAVQNDWGLISQTSRTKGWKMLKDNEPIII